MALLPGHNFICTSTADLVDEPPNLYFVQITTLLLGNYRKPNNYSFQTLPAITLRIPICPTFGVNIRLTTASNHLHSHFPFLAYIHHCPVALFGTFESFILTLLFLVFEPSLWSQTRPCRYMTNEHNLTVFIFNSRGVKPSAFMADLRKEKPHATFLLKHVPHIIPRKEVCLFAIKV